MLDRLNRTMLLAVAVCVVLGLGSLTMARPVEVYSYGSVHGDACSLNGVVHELGAQYGYPVFPSEEAVLPLDYRSTSYDPYPPGKTGSAYNKVVEIQNICGRPVWDLYYVADLTTSVTNYDGYVGESGYHESVAFKIDRVGANKPLIFESMRQDQVFEPGEIWHFVLQDFQNNEGHAPHLMGSYGIGAASIGEPFSSGSLITPEPATLSVLAFGGIAVLIRRRRQRHRA